MTGALAVLLITLGLGQLDVTRRRLYGLSLAGINRRTGYALGAALLLAGVLLLPQTFAVLGWSLVSGPLALGLLLLGGAYLRPIPRPESLFEPGHPAHGSCVRLDIPDGVGQLPGLLLHPPAGVTRREAAICIVPGAGDTKTFFKWLLVRTLLAEGFTVLAIDLPGHGEYRYRPLRYPDCLTTIPAAVDTLRAEPGIRQVALIGISLGGAVAIRALAEAGPGLVEALVVVGTPVRLRYDRAMFYREVWNTLFRAPSLALFREMTARQAKETWDSGGYRSRHSTSQLFELLNPLEHIEQLPKLPLLLLYSEHDSVAPPEHARLLRQRAPQAVLLESKKASHVLLTLMPENNRAITCWLKQVLP